MFYPEASVEVPAVTAEQMREVDRLMVDEYGIQLIQMMENAGRALAAVARDVFLERDVVGRRVTVLAGRGGNGGGALVGARHLRNWGAAVHVAVAVPADRFQGVPARQLAILRAMDVPIGEIVPDSCGDLILDGLIGYNLGGNPRGSAGEFIRWANAQPCPVLALDVPSGLDATTGEARTPTVAADATLTLALPKTGLMLPENKPYVGELYLADIGVPPELYARPPVRFDMGSVFARSEVMRLTVDG